MRHHTTASPALGGPEPSDDDRSSPEVVSITAARAPHSDDIRKRMIKYAVTMGIRMVCIALIFVFDGWYRLIPVIGAVVLPWFAVIIANGGSDTSTMDTSSLLDEAPLYQLEAEPGNAQDTEDAHEVLNGEVIDDEPDDDGPTSGTRKAE